MKKGIQYGRIWKNMSHEKRDTVQKDMSHEKRRDTIWKDISHEMEGYSMEGYVKLNRGVHYRRICHIKKGYSVEGYVR